MITERYQHLLDPKVARAFVTEFPNETLGALRLLWNAATEAAARKKRPARRSA